MPCLALPNACIQVIVAGLDGRSFQLRIYAWRRECELFGFAPWAAPGDAPSLDDVSPAGGSGSCALTAINFEYHMVGVE